MEQMQYNLLVSLVRRARHRRSGLGADRVHEEPRPAAEHRDGAQVPGAILAHDEVAPLLSDEHFSVDGTLVEAWASMKSFQPKAAASG